MPAQLPSLVPPVRQGLQIYTTSVSTSYYTFSIPNDQLVSTVSALGSQAAPIGSDFSTTAGVSIGWNRARENSDFGFVYTPSYTSYASNPKFNTLNQTLLLRLGRPLQLSPRTTVNFSVNTNIQNFREYLFSGTAGIAPELASNTAGTVSPLPPETPIPGAAIDSPLRLLIYGDRMLDASVQGGLTYNYSPRLSFNVQTGFAREQRLSSPNVDSTQTNVYLVPQTTSGFTSAGATWKMSATTDIGASLKLDQTFSAVANTLSSTGDVYLSRSVSRHWRVRVHGGAGRNTPISERLGYAPVRGVQYQAGASALYKSRRHALQLQWERAIYNSYGISGDNTNLNASWNWRLPFRDWSVIASTSRQHFNGGSFANLTSLLSAAGVTRRVGSRTQVQLQYTYATYKGPFGGTNYTFSQSGIRLSVIWAPKLTLF